MKKKAKVAACDCCGGPNERAEWSNYCAKCAEETDMQCSCGCSEVHEVAWRRTADNKRVTFWSDGPVTGPFGFNLRGVGSAKSAWSTKRDLRAVWIVADLVGFLDFSEVGAAVKTARKLCEKSGWTIKAAIGRAVLDSLDKRTE
jgi:hypothetical protein